MLTLLLANQLNESHQLAELRALTQATLAAARLSRHRQEQLGRLCRIAVREGDRSAALEALAAMTVDPPDIESDSELRVSAAALATLVGDSELVLSLVGPSATAVPIEQGLQPLAIVLRAHAHEQLGQLASAAGALRELPHFGMLADLNRTYPTLALCPRSSVQHDELGVSVHRSLPAPIGTWLIVGPLFLAIAGIVIIPLSSARQRGYADTSDLVISSACVLLLLLLGVPLTLSGLSSRRRITFLRQHGHARRARVIQIEGTTSAVGDIPIYALTLELAGPAGPYRVRVNKALHAPAAAAIVGQSLNILASPSDPTDAILDEATLV